MPKGIYQRKYIPLGERFWKFVSPEPNSGCWLWTGSLNTAGYGQLNVGVEGSQIPERAHRLAYYMYVGDIPPGTELDHKCRVRSCVNPDHLEAVTHVENVQRGLAGQYMRELKHTQTSCARGHRFTPENTYISANGAHRNCKTCAAAASQRWRVRKQSIFAGENA